MKKIFALIAIAAMVAVSCGKPDDNKGGKNDNKNEDEEYVAPITIDGDFADWAKLDASKMATATTNPDANKTALKLVKVYADELFVYVYFEWDKDQISHEPDVEHVPFHVYINGDGDTSTGGFADQWLDACADVMFEGFLTDGTNVVSYEPGVYQWVGEPNGSGWDDCWEELGDFPGLTSGAGVEGKYEMAITRELYPIGKWANTFSIGFDIQQDWDSVGILPNDAVSEDNPSGHANSLTVITNK